MPLNLRRSAPLLGALLLAACAGGEGDAEVEMAEAASAPAAARAADSTLHVLDLRPGRPTTRGADSALLAEAVAEAGRLPRIRCLLVARHGETLTEWCAGSRSPGGYANVKSVSKSVLSAVAGLAIADGHLQGTDQPIAPFFADYLGPDTDPRKARITVGNLLSMQSGLERTSGGNYGEWVSSRNWVRYAVTRPMEEEPGGPMLYSTGNSHLLSAIVTEATGRSTWAYARERLAEPLGIELPRWTADPQGIYFGGNEMRLTPRAMLAFGELYRNAGRHQGRQVVPEAWVRESLVPRTRSPWSGERYGYGWFLSDAGGYPMFYAWGYGGQFIFVVPDLELTVVTTSDPDAARERDHLRQIHRILDFVLVPAAERGDG